MNLHICADDIGQDPAINAGCLELFYQGSLSAVSVLSEAPHVRSSVNELRAAQLQGLEIGLHFNLTLAFDNSLVIKALPEWILRSQLGQIPKKVVLKSLIHQLDTFEEIFQAPPDFVDGHQHVHQFPGIRNVFLEALSRRYPQKKPWIRSTLLPHNADHVPEPLKCEIINRLGGVSFRAMLLKSGFTCNEGFLGVYGFNLTTPELYAEYMANWLDCAGSHSLLMVHPANQIIANDGISEARYVEYTYLKSPQFTELLASKSVLVKPWISQ